MFRSLIEEAIEGFIEQKNPDGADQHIRFAVEKNAHGAGR